MPDRSRIRPGDLNQLVASVVDESTSDPPRSQAGTAKNPAAVALGRLGGLKGGKARANKLSPEERHEIAKRAAAERWRDK